MDKIIVRLIDNENNFELQHYTGVNAGLRVFQAKLLQIHVSKGNDTIAGRQA